MISKKLTKFTLAGSTSVALILAGGVGPATATTLSPTTSEVLTANKVVAAASSETSEAAGRQIYEALFFGTGPKADAVEKELQDSKYAAFRAHVADMAPEQSSVARSVLARIDSKHPEFFSNFALKMTSGDVFAVETTFETAVKHLQEAFTDLQPKTKLGAIDADAANPQAMIPIFLYAAAVWHVAVAVQYAVAVNARAYFNVATAVNTVNISSASTSVGIEKEQIIANMTGSFSGENVVSISN